MKPFISSLVFFATWSIVTSCSSPEEMVEQPVAEPVAEMVEEPIEVVEPEMEEEEDAPEAEE